MRRKILLKVNRFKQKYSDCGIAACASLINYYDPAIKYENVRKQVDSSVLENGTFTCQQALLLNQFGFKRVSVVSADDIFDFTWQRRSVAWKIQRLKKLKTYSIRTSQHESYIELVKLYVDFLEKPDCQNNLIIDWDFPKWIKRSIRKGHPLLSSINYTAYFRISKEREDEKYDDIRGEAVEHAFVIRGFDDNHIYIVDSRGKKTKEYSGYYKIKWYDFLVNIGKGDLIFLT